MATLTIRWIFCLLNISILYPSCQGGRFLPEFIVSWLTSDSPENRLDKTSVFDKPSVSEYQSTENRTPHYRLPTLQTGYFLELQQQGRESLELLQEKSSESACWKEAFTAIQESCKTATQEQKQRLALQVTKCHLEGTRYEYQGCVQTLEVSKCLDGTDEFTFSIYTSFYLHIEDVCHFLEQDVWEHHMQQTIRHMTHTSQAAVEKLVQSLSLQELSLQTQQEIFRAAAAAEQKQEELQARMSETHATLASHSAHLGPLVEGLVDRTEQQRREMAALAARQAEATAAAGALAAGLAAARAELDGQLAGLAAARREAEAQGAALAPAARLLGAWSAAAAGALAAGAALARAALAAAAAALLTAPAALRPARRPALGAVALRAALELGAATGSGGATMGWGAPPPPLAALLPPGARPLRPVLAGCLVAVLVFSALRRCGGGGPPQNSKRGLLLSGEADAFLSCGCGHLCDLPPGLPARGGAGEFCALPSEGEEEEEEEWCPEDYPSGGEESGGGEGEEEDLGALPDWRLRALAAQRGLLARGRGGGRRGGGASRAALLRALGGGGGGPEDEGYAAQ